MIGPARTRRLDEPIAVSLEGLVSHRNFHRHLEAQLDLSFVRDWTQALDAELPRGIVQLPIAPEVARAEGDPLLRLLEERRLDPNRSSHRGYRRTSRFRVSPTDPDASPMWNWSAIRLGYHDHYGIDGGADQNMQPRTAVHQPPGLAQILDVCPSERR